MKKENNKSLLELVIELDEINRKIERIKTDDEYIKQKSNEIFKNRKSRDYSKELQEIINLL